MNKTLMMTGLTVAAFLSTSYVAQATEAAPAAEEAPAAAAADKADAHCGNDAHCGSKKDEKGEAACGEGSCGAAKGEKPAEEAK